MKSLQSLFLSTVCCLLSASVLWSSQLKGKGIAIAMEIATNPGGFLYDLHQMTESVAPNRTDKRFTIATGFMPTLLPFAFANVSGRLSLLQEHPGIPQVEVFGGYDNLIALNYVDTEETEGKVSGRHYGLSVTKSVHPKARLHLSLERSTLIGKVTFKKKPLEVYGTTLNSITVNLEEDFFFVGAEIFRGKRKYMFSQMGYGLNSSKIVARIFWVGRVFDFGLTVYPEGALVVYPTLNLRFGF